VLVWGVETPKGPSTLEAVQWEGATAVWPHGHDTMAEAIDRRCYIEEMLNFIFVQHRL
jgi:hypothetical protein